VKGLSKPPEGVVVGESVPRENDERQLKNSLVDRLAHEMKAHPAYRDMTDGERRELAAEKLADRTEDK